MDKIRVLSPRLRYRTRARLYVVERIDSTACRLIEHGHLTAADRLWQIFRLR